MEGLKGMVQVSLSGGGERRSVLVCLGLTEIQISHEKPTATFKSGTTLHAIHAELDAASPPMAMRNIGSISDQTIGGLISTASHGSGITFPVISQHVRSITLALPLPGIPVVRVTETDDVELFKASLCGLGATGLMLEVEIEIEAAFRLEEKKEARGVMEVLDSLDEIKTTAEHVRVWWYPHGKGMVVGRANRTYAVSIPGAQCSSYQLIPLACPTCSIARGTRPRLPCDPVPPLLFPHLPFSLLRRRPMGLVSRQGGQCCCGRRLQGSQL